MTSKTFCASFPFNPTDTYPQLMSDSRALTSHKPNDLLNCKIMQNYAKETGKPFDPRGFRQLIVRQGKGLESYQNQCLDEKYTRMQAEMKQNLEKLNCLDWN